MKEGTTITLFEITFETPGNEWPAYVMDCLRDKSLAEAGKELMLLATYALDTKQDQRFLADLNICLVAYWQKCCLEIEAEQVWEEQL